MRSISGAEILHERCMHPLNEFYRTIVKIGKMLPNHHIKSTSCTSKFWKGDSGVVYTWLNAHSCQASYVYQRPQRTIP